jgi:DNA replication protein DnaC
LASLSNSAEIWPTRDVLILDDLGYLKQRANESEVLFTLIAER